MTSDNLALFRLEALKSSNEDLDEFMSNRESALSRDFLLQDDQVHEDKFKLSSQKVIKLSID